MARRQGWRAVMLALVLVVVGLAGSPPARAVDLPDLPGLPQIDTPVPVVTGAAQFGSTLVASPGTWDDGVVLAFQWLRAGTPIAGATAPSYPVGIADLGASLSVAVTGTKLLHETVTRVSEPTPPVARASLAAGVVRITGKPQVGRGLLARPRGFEPGTVAHYRWLVGSRVVGKRASLEVTRSMAGSRVTLEATVTKPGYEPVTVGAVSGKVAERKRRHRR